MANPTNPQGPQEEQNPQEHQTVDVMIAVPEGTELPSRLHDILDELSKELQKYPNFPGEGDKSRCLVVCKEVCIKFEG